MEEMAMSGGEVGNDVGRDAPSITISDVARLAGVGESTVSRVLRGKGPVAEDTRERVLAAVRQLGYVPNRIAGTLASYQSHLVALIIPSITNIVFGDVLSGSAQALAASAHQAVFAVTDYDDEQEEVLIESMLAWRPAGIVVAGVEHTPHSITMLKGAGIRVAEILDTDGPGIDIVVGYSNIEAGRTSARFLVARGKRRIGFVGDNPQRDRRAGKRFAGFSQALAEAGLAVADTEISPTVSSVEAGRVGLATLLARTPNLDAVYFANDDLAIGGLFHCMASGIDVPGQLALMGYNGLDVGQAAPRPLTTIRTPRREIGELAAQLLCSNEPSQVRDLGFELLEGATV
jgi:LacI family transcriptional regulator, gluconate utilization system Gnt-I transcriptional repressor